MNISQKCCSRHVHLPFFCLVFTHHFIFAWNNKTENGALNVIKYVFLSNAKLGKNNKNSDITRRRKKTQHERTFYFQN